MISARKVFKERVALGKVLEAMTDAIRQVEDGFERDTAKLGIQGHFLRSKILKDNLEM